MKRILFLFKKWMSIRGASLRLVLITLLLMCAAGVSAQTIRYVKQGGTGDGSSWANASGNVQAMINASGAAEQVWVAAGSYSMPAGESFTLKDSVQIYGGFPATGSPVLADRNFKNNETKLVGNSARVVYSDSESNVTVLDGFTLTGGTDNNLGGAGIYMSNSNARLSNMLIKDNYAGQSAGMYINGGAPYITYMRITGNMAENQVGGLTMLFCNATLRDCVIDHNNVSPTAFAAAVYVYGGAPKIVSTTIADNMGGIYADGSPALLITNSIIWGNKNADGSPNNLYDTGTGTFPRYSLIEGSGGSANWNANHYGTDGGNNLDVNPIFTNPSGGDYSLYNNSPAINAGLSSDYVNYDDTTSKDFGGKPRIFGTAIDMGAYEAQFAFSPVLYVKVGGTGDGTSWENAAGDIQQLIDASNAGQEIWVAKGSYQRGNQEYINLKEGVKIYGGFPDSGNPGIGDRNFTANETILLGNNNWVVYAGLNISNASLLDGFTITGGYKVEAGGAGIEIMIASPTLNNLVVKNNTGEVSGVGGIRVVNGSAVITNTSVINNTGASAGGIYVTGGGEFSPVIRNVLVANNFAVVNGGILLGGDSNAPDLFTPELTNVTVANNTAQYQGGGVFIQYATPTVNNTIIWGNTLDGGQNSNYFANNSSPTISNSLISGTFNQNGWNTDAGTNGGGNLDTDPLFTNAGIGDFTLQANSPAVNAGNNAFFPDGATSKDVAGNARTVGTIDMGAYESAGAVIMQYYVKEGGTGSGDSWANASGNLFNVLNNVPVGGQVWVAAGNYPLASGSSYRMTDNVKIYGGFPATGNPGMVERNWITNATTLTGNGAHVIRNNNNNLTETAVLDGFIITGGSGVSYGGGIFNDNASPLLNNLVIRGNEANTGGGIYTFNSTTIITNSIITGNTAGNRGGGLYFADGMGEITNVTVADNTASFGSNLYFYYSAAQVENTIAWSTQPGTVVVNGNQPQFTNSLIQGSNGSSAWNTAYGIDGGNNIDANPLFTNPLANDYSIAVGSPAHNAGDAVLYANSATAKDFKGNKRVDGSAIDIGAYEVATELPIKYVLPTNSGLADGSSWDNASSNLQAMINNSPAGGEVWVAEGHYTTTDGQPFQMKEGVAIYGGFPAAGFPVMADRDFNAYFTRLYNTANTILYNNNNNLTRASILDGFALSFGDGGAMAGGIQNNNASPTLRNLNITNNTGGLGGGYAEVNSNALLYNVLIASNTGNDGGAISTQTSTSEFINTTIYSNISNNVGSAIVHNNSAAVFSNTIIDANFSSQSSGPIVNVGPSVSGLVFNSNIIQQTGGSANWDTDLGTDGGNNLNADPMIGYNGTYGVDPASPAVNNGNTSYFPDAATATDLAGNPRVFQNTIDIGAFESQVYNPSIYYVKQDAQGTGTSWANASGDLQAMLTIASAQDKIFVAAGNYTPPTGSFTMKEGVEVYGGFAATGNPGMINRDWVANATVLTGIGSSVIVNNNNNLTAAAVLDGFIITGGTSATMGGGIYNNNVSPLFNNLVITGNSANTGGGFAAIGGNTVITSSIIHSNTSATEGGAMYFENGTGIITNTTIANNTAIDNSIISFNNAAITINNTIAWNAQGGAIATAGSQVPTFASSLIQGSANGGAWNTAYGTDGGNNIDADPLFTDTANNNFSIGITSPAYNTGDAALFANAATAIDFAGYKRLDGGAIEMGAYEVPTDTNIRYVRNYSEGNADGSSWDNASDNLQLMIDTNYEGGQVWVAEGYYSPLVSGESFRMKEGIAIYGGFPSYGDPGMAERNPAQNVSQLTTNYNGTVILNVDNNLTHAAILDGFYISNGSSETAAGGIQNTNVSPLMRNLIIQRNNGSNGGGYGEINSNAIVYNVVIDSNNAESGGAISSENSTSVFTNLTLANNSAYNGGGAFRHSSTASVIQNSVVWNNDNYDNDEADTVTPGMPNGLTFTSSLIEGSGSSSNWNSAYGINGGGNIDADPQYTDYEYDYTVQAVSPAINGGNTALFPDAATASDINGNPRVFQNTIDMGAFEYQDFVSSRFYVKQGATGTGNSWANASGDIQQVTTLAAEGDQIWVAAGTYTPVSGSFTLKEGVKLYGGFPATGSPDMDDRNPAEFTSVLSSPSSTVLSITDSAITSETLADGFSVSGGGGSAAVVIEYAAPVLNNFTISNNYNRALDIKNSFAFFNNLTVAYNTGAGGAIAVTDTESQGSSPAFTNTLIHHNVFTGNGGGMYINGANPALSNVTIASNSATAGGGMYIENSDGLIVNSIIYGNTGDNVTLVSSYTQYEHSLIGGSGGSGNWDAAFGNDSGDNIDTNPLFADADAGNYSLITGSPAANTGDNSLLFGAYTQKDLAGNARVISSEIDMGALESLANSAIKYVRQDATGAGTSWADAMGDLKGAIATAYNGDEVWVAAGMYIPQEEGYSLKEGVKVYGGFPATGNPGMSDRNWGTNVTVLKRNNIGNTESIIENTSGNITADTVLDGFTLTGNTGDESGIFLIESSPALRNLIISTLDKSGIVMHNSSPRVTNVVITKTAWDTGDSMEIYGETSHPVFTNITVTNNYSSIDIDNNGSASFYNSLLDEYVSAYGDEVTFTNCSIKGYDGTAGNWDDDYTDGGGNIAGDVTMFSDGRLAPGSSAINSGNNAFLDTAASPYDAGGSNRIYDGIVDIGAYEEQGTPAALVHYVKQGGTGNGNSWAEASGSIQDMLDISASGHKVLVAAGLYLPSQNSAYRLTSGVQLLGGYAATGNPAVEDRDWKANLTELNANGYGIIESENCSDETLVDGFVIANASGDYFGVINTYNGSPVYSNLIVRNNSTDYYFNFVIINASGSPEFRNVLIYNNSMNLIGGYGSEPVFNNITVADNTATTFIESDGDDTITFNNSIIWQNGVISASQSNGSSVVFTNSIVRYSGGSVNWAANATDGGNNLDSDPLFTNTEAGDYTLQANSPAVNAGNTALYANAATSTDLAGNPRVGDGTIDMGALERTVSTTITYVRQDATGTGTSWDDATGNLDNAITNAVAGSEVWVAAGTYLPNGNYFGLKEGVKIYGGFPATGNPGMADRDWSTNTSLMTADEYDLYSYIIRNDGGGITNEALLDGFTISMAAGDDGTAMYLNGAAPTLKNLTIKGNTQGGIEIVNASPVVSNSLVIDNARAGRAAIGIDGICSPVFTNITVTSPENGFLSLYNGCTPQFYNSIITIGLATMASSDATFTNCYVYGLGGSASWQSSQNDGGNNIDGEIIIQSDGSIIPGSIAINAGNNAFTTAAGITLDIAGNPRIYDNTVDLGAFEEQGEPVISIRYVRQGATGNGTSWDDASGNLQDMINISSAGHKVLVASGTYLTQAGRYYDMKDGVSVYGGYAPTGNPAFEDRDWAANSTILSGNGGNSGPIVAYSVGDQTVIDGFVLVNSSGSYAAGLYTYDSYATFNNMVIRDNAGDANSAAIFNEDSNPVFNNVVVYNNSILPILNVGSSPIFNNLTVSGNSSSDFIYNGYDSYPVYNNSILWQDGTIINEDASQAIFVNSIVKNSGGSTNWSFPATDGGNNLDTDPLFTNPSAGNYTLQAGSPAINAGNTALYANAATSRDLAGNPRVEGGSIDLGAYEKEGVLCGIATEWDGTAWSNGTPDSFSYSAVINGNYDANVNGEITACSLTVTSGIVLVTSGNVFTVKGAVNVAGNASLTFENNAHLIQEDDVNNTGIIESHRNSSELYRLDYTLWSSPVAGQNLKQFSINTVNNRFYKYDTENDYYVSSLDNALNPLNDDFETATGYLIRMPQSGTPGYNGDTESRVFDGTFTGVPHNGNINIGLSNLGNRYNLVGNPYPSPLNLGAFFAGNTQSIDGIIYIWRKRNGQSVTSAYVTMNSVGDFTTNNQPGADDPDGVLQTAQGFLVRAKESAADTNVHFTNAMRSNDVAHDSSFFRNGGGEKHRLWLNLTSQDVFINQALIGYRENATMGIDTGIDAGFINDTKTAFNSLINNQPYAIQGRSLPFEDTDVVPMQFKTDVAGSYTVALHKTDGLFEDGQDIYIKDNITGTLHNIKQGSYSFATEAGLFNNRFEVHYRQVPLLSTPGAGFTANNVIIYKQDRTIHITTGNVIMKGIKVFDTQGRLVYSQDNVNAAKAEIANLQVAEQMLIVQITTTENVVVSRKIIY